MLAPHSEVKRIELEGVAAEDLATGALSDDRFVGVDLAEYQGGDDGRSARCVIITQVKYSPLHPDRPWTLARLASSRTGRGRSVIAKLAEAFASLRKELAGTHVVGAPPQIAVRLHTNQPLDAAVTGPLTRAQDAVQRRHSGTSAEPLADLPADDLRVLAELRAATQLGDEEFVEFVVAWDVAEFGRPMLTEEEAALWTALQTFTSDAGVHVGNLLSFVQERATTMRRKSVRRDDVLGLLRVLDQDFWPAPPLFEDRADLIETDDLRRLLAALPAAAPPELAREPARPVITSDTLTSGRGTVSADVLLVHGRSGTGKTSTLRLLARAHGHGAATIVYDCFANAKGLEPTSARFPVQTCFAQVVNELDVLLGTAVFATARLELHHLVARLERAVRSAADSASRRGMRLVLAFDAVDNAQQAASRTPVQVGESFVPLLWTIAWPKNCTVIASARTENLDLLGLPLGGGPPQGVRVLELHGFSRAETARAAAGVSETDTSIVDRLHQRTRGNPRVVRRVLEALGQADTAARAIQAECLAVIDRIARDNAFDYYRAETPQRLRSREDRDTLGLLAEAMQSLTVGQLALVAGRPVPEISALVARLAFGLRLDPDGRIAFRDQDFWDFTHEEFRAECTDARAALADYVRAHYDADDPYARANLSRHLYAAGRLSVLVDWWVEGDRLARDIDARAPYLERALEDVRYALLAASELGRDADALTLLSLGGDIVQGRDLFLEHLLGRPEWSVSIGALDEVIAALDHQDAGSGLAARYTGLANAAAADSAYRHRVSELLNRAAATRREIYRRNQAQLANRLPRRPGDESQREYDDLEGDVANLWRGVFELEDIRAQVSALARTGQADEALAWLGSLRPRDHLGEAFRTLAREAIFPEAGAAGVRAAFRRLAHRVTRLKLGPAVRAEWALGVLIGGAYRLGDRACDSLVAAVVSAASQGGFRPRPGDVRHAIEALAATGATTTAARLIPLALVDPPHHPHDPSIEEFLRGLALREALGLAAFDPSEFDLPRPPGEAPLTPGPLNKAQSGVDYAARQREEERANVIHALRDRFAMWYPAELLRARAQIGVSPPEAQSLLADVRMVVETWSRSVRSGSMNTRRDFSSDYARVMCALFEAVVRLPYRDAELIRAAVAAADDILPPGSGRRLEHAAKTLAQDQRYHGEAESVISLLRRDAKPPITRPADAVDILLAAREAALHFDADLATLLVLEAREVANAIEAEIPGRVVGLLAVADRATARVAPTTTDSPVSALSLEVRRFVWLVAYLATVADDSREIGVARALRYLARADARAVAVESIHLDAQGVLDIEDGAPAIALGLIDAGVAPIDTAWPLARLGRQNDDRVFRAALQAAHLRGEAVDPMLAAYGAHLCRGAWRADGERALETFLEWVPPSIGSHPVVVTVRDFLHRLKRLPPSSDGALGEGRATHAGIGNPTWRSPRNEADERLAPVRSALSDSPAAALDALAALPKTVFRDASVSTFVSLVADLADALPSARLGELAILVERAPAHGGAFQALAAVAARSGTPAARAAVIEAYRRLLTPEALRILASHHYPDASRAAFGFELLRDRERLREIVGAIGRTQADLDAAVLYRLAGRLAVLITPEEAQRVLAALVGRAWARVPPEIRSETKRDQDRRSSAAPDGLDERTVAIGAVIALLSDLHGHPSQRVRWGAVHGAVDAALALSRTVPGLLVTETFDAVHPRWLTKREWLLFTLECVSRRAPEALAPYTAQLAAHALSAELPHAKIRHHAREIVLAVHASVDRSNDVVAQGRLDATLVERVRAVNQPVAKIPRRRAEQTSTAHQRPRRRGNESWPEYHFDDTDTLRYWYEPLARAFGLFPADVADLAYPWIVGRWGVTWSTVQATWKTLHGRWRWEELSHSHGTEPAVESLERYADRHGLYVAAGVLVDTKPVVDDGPREGDRWTDWGRYHLRGADPALPARLLVAPPPDSPDQYGRFSAPYEQWRRPKGVDAFLAEIGGSPVMETLAVGIAADAAIRTCAEPDAGGWVVLSARRSGTVGDRSFVAWVTPALVSRGTVRAFQRLVHDSPRGVSLPELRLSHDTILPDIENDLRTRSDYYLSERHWIHSRDHRFVLRALGVDMFQEMAFHASEPLWPSLGRGFHVPALNIILEYNLRRDPVSLNWRAPDGRIALRSEVWSQSDGSAEYSDHVQGVRLLGRRDMLVDYARRRDAEVLLVVTLQRHRPYGRQNRKEPYDRGESVAFILGPDGIPAATPRGTRAPDTSQDDRQRLRDAGLASTDVEQNGYGAAADAAS